LRALFSSPVLVPLRSALFSARACRSRISIVSAPKRLSARFCFPPSASDHQSLSPIKFSVSRCCYFVDRFFCLRFHWPRPWFVFGADSGLCCSSGAEASEVAEGSVFSALLHVDSCNRQFCCSPIVSCRDFLRAARFRPASHKR
jgi:hypothetical protein